MLTEKLELISLTEKLEPSFKEEYQQEALRKLKQMTADDFIRIFEECGSIRATKDNLVDIISRDLERLRKMAEFESVMNIEKFKRKVEKDVDK